MALRGGVRPSGVAVRDSALKYLFKAQGQSKLLPYMCRSDAQDLYAGFTKSDTELTAVVKNGVNRTKLRYLVDHARIYGIFDMKFNLKHGNDMVLFLKILQSKEVSLRGLGSLMRGLVTSKHAQLGNGMDLLKQCGCQNGVESDIKHAFLSLYTPKMKQVTIDVLIQNEPMACLKFLEWYKESSDFSQEFYSFAKFKLLTQQFNNRFFIPVQFTDKDVHNIIQKHIGAYLALLMSQPDSVLPPKEKFDNFLAILFKSLEKYHNIIPKGEIQKCNSLFLNFLVKNYNIDYNILLAYITSLFPSESNLQFMISLNLISNGASVLQHEIPSVTDLPKVSVNEKLVSKMNGVSIYLSDLNLIYQQLLQHRHLQDKDVCKLFNKYIELSKCIPKNTPNESHPFSDNHHNTSILVTFLKYVTFELHDLQLAYKFLRRYIQVHRKEAVQRDLELHKKHKHVIGVVISKLSNKNLDKANEIVTNLNLVWDWDVYWKLIINALKLNQLSFSRKIWEKVRQNRQLWRHIKTEQAAMLLSLGFDFNREMTLAIHENNSNEETKAKQVDREFLVNELSTEYIIKLLN